MVGGDHLPKVVSRLLSMVCLLLVVVCLSATAVVCLHIGVIDFSSNAEAKSDSSEVAVVAATPTLWRAPDSTLLARETNRDLIYYGRDLIAHTSRYLGPNGSVASITNGMNCQNCHLQAGTKPFGNNYGKVASTYPKLRARSGEVEDIPRRINDCIQRSLNGDALDRDSREMRAMVAYMLWVGRAVNKTDVYDGFGLLDLKPLDRAADPVAGKRVYTEHCVRCHGINGEGQKAPNDIEWTYPPLFGDASYNTGAGLYRLSRFAGYVKANMPDGTTFDKPVLTDEQAWDVAAYVNSMARPTKHFAGDWPDVTKKPFDHPFGPYADSFPEAQHKYGPFAPIVAAGKH